MLLNTLFLCSGQGTFLTHSARRFKYLGGLRANFISERQGKQSTEYSQPFPSPSLHEAVGQHSLQSSFAAKILHRSPSHCPSESLINFNSRWTFGFLTPSPHALAMFLFSYWVAHACFHCLLSFCFWAQSEATTSSMLTFCHTCSVSIISQGTDPVLLESCPWRSTSLLGSWDLQDSLDSSPLSDLTNSVPWNSPHRPCFLDSWTYTSYLLGPLQFLHISQNSKDGGGPKLDTTFQMQYHQYQA